MLYSKNGSYPAPLPHRIVMPDGLTRTDASTFTEEEIAAAGYVVVEDQPIVEYPNKVDWTSEGWVVRGPNETEIYQERQRIKEACVARLAETDYKVIKAVELGTPVEIAYVTYRQELRALYNNVDNVDPFSIQMPMLQEQPAE